MLVHVVKETDAGIVIRGAKYETAAAYANQAFLKPTIANWGDSKLSEYALGCIVKMNAPGVKHICRTGFAGRAPARDYPLSNGFDEIDTLVILDDVLIPWEDVLFYQHTRAAAFIRQTLHRYSAFPFVQRTLSFADLMIGAALWNVRQTGLDKQQAVQEKLAELAVWREGINAHLTACGRDRREKPERSSHAEPVAALHRPRPRHVQPAARSCTSPASSAAARSASPPMPPPSRTPETGHGSRSTIPSTTSGWPTTAAGSLALARDLLNSDYAGHRLTFQLFAQSPPFAHLAAVYRDLRLEGAARICAEGRRASPTGSGARQKMAAE